MGSFSLISPMKVLELQEKMAVTGRTKFQLNTEGLVFVYIDNYKNIFLPVLRLEIKSRDIELDSGSDNEFYSGLDVQLSHNNSRTAKWEPVIEPIHFDIIYKSQDRLSVINLMAGDQENPENLCINFSEELLETSLHCLRNAKSVIDSSTLDDERTTGIKNEITRSESEGEDKIYESQFLVRNLTGYDFAIQTLGDRKSFPILIRNLQERFVSFMLDDEFSTKDSKKTISLSFTEQIHQSRLF